MKNEWILERVRMTGCARSGASSKRELDARTTFSYLCTDESGKNKEEEEIIFSLAVSRLGVMLQIGAALEISPQR